MLQHIAYWVFFNKAHNKNFRDDHYWTWTTLKGLTEIFPFWSVSTIRRILNSLEKQNCIYTGCYNEKGADRTKWYTLTETMCQNEHFHLLKSTNGIVETDKAIPDILNQDIKTNIYTPLISPQGETPQESISKNKKSARAKSPPQVPLAPLPYHSAKFNEVWEFLCSMPKWKNKTNYALNLSIRKLSQVTEAEAIGMIEEAIEKGWQGIFLPKDKQQSFRKPPKYVDIKDIM